MKERVLVLKCIKYGESDLIVHALNSQGGRMNFIAKGALKSRKRFGGGVLEPTHFIAVEYHPAKSDASAEPLYFLQEASVVRDFPKLRENYDRLNVALEMVQIVEKLARPGEVETTKIFDLLGNALGLAETSKDLSRLKLQFQAKLLYLEGILPPDVGFKDLLKFPLAAHDEIELSEDLFSRLEWELQVGLQRYLKGLNPLDSESFN